MVMIHLAKGKGKMFPTEIPDNVKPIALDLPPVEIYLKIR